MDIDLDELYCDRNTLLQILAALKAVRPSKIRLESKHGALGIQASNNERRYSTRGCSDFVTVHIPYGGMEDAAFAKPKDLLREIQNTEEDEVFEVPGAAQPLGWEKDFPVMGTKRGAPYDGKGLHQALNFLLRVDPFSCLRMEYGGILMRDSEMLVTDRFTMHIHQGLPPLRKDSVWLWGGDAASCLHRLMRVLPPDSLHVHSSRETLFFVLRNEMGVEAVVSSTFRLKSYPNTEPFDTRLPVNEQSLGLAVHTEFLVSILQATIDAARGSPAIHLRTGEGQLHYTSVDWTDKGRRDVYKGEIPMGRSLQNQGNVEITLDANKLKDAVAGLGDVTQIIIPCHPHFGFEFYSISPVYVNCNPNQFSVIMPVSLDSEAALHLRRKYEHANQKARYQ